MVVSFFRKYLGYGSMRDEDIASQLMEGQESGFDSMIRRTITKVLIEIVLKWFKTVITKYPEDEVHRRFEAGFSLHQDMIDNHPEKYAQVVQWGKRLHKLGFSLNIEIMLTKIVEVLKTETEWQLQPIEYKAFKDFLEALRHDIEG